MFLEPKCLLLWMWIEPGSATYVYGGGRSRKKKKFSTTQLLNTRVKKSNVPFPHHVRGVIELPVQLFRKKGVGEIESGSVVATAVGGLNASVHGGPSRHQRGTSGGTDRVDIVLVQGDA